MKAVFDTNVLLAAFLTEGVCAKLLIRARKPQFHLITCPFILHEFDRILSKKFSATKQERENALALIAEAAQHIVLIATSQRNWFDNVSNKYILNYAVMV